VDEDVKQEFTMVAKELEAINNEKTRGNQIRARAMHIECNEKNSAYFFNKEKANYQIKNISTLHKEDGTVVTEQKEIMNCQYQFYKSLYSQPECNNTQERTEANNYFLEQEGMTKIDDVDKESLEQEITYEDIAKATQELSNGKAPGSDGFPVEFYKFFWAKIKNLVCDSIINAVHKGELSIDQKRGVLSLLPKKDKDIRWLKNWRPLTLLNTDYKIFAKAIATKLQSVLPTLISHDQNGCMKQRSAFSNIRSTIDIITHVNEENLHGILTYIDFHKAFDTVNWAFMKKVLRELNFGPFFIKCIETMYNKIETCVINNGNISEFFKPTRGIRQGCPLSANLFILIVEVLSHSVKRNESIRGIKIDNREYKISQYADDTCLFLEDDTSLKMVITVFQTFAKCSGLQINMDKSEAIWIGASSNYLHKPCNLKWTKGATCLGVYITNDIREISEINYKKSYKI
jgi:hypothetical protein